MQIQKIKLGQQSGMHKRGTCNCCKNEADMADMFVFNEENYCVRANCLFDLLFALQDEDIISIDLSNKETCGWKISRPI